MEGQTILLSLHLADAGALSSTEVISSYLMESVKIAGLTPILNSLQVFSFPVLGQEHTQLTGITGGIILLESHMYLHTWPENNYIRIELSSCRALKDEQVIALRKYSNEIFKTEKCEIDLIGW